MEDVPIYLVPEQRFSVIDRPLGVLAWTSYFCDIQVSDRMRELGLWKGKGFATVIFLDRLSHSTRELRGAVLHEFAHYLTFPPRPESYSSLDATAANEWVAIANASADASKNDSPPWRNHDPEFVRAACHLAHRAKRLCDVASHNLSFSYWYYGCNEDVWMNTLRDELTSMASVPIRDILKTAPPSDFSTLARILTQN